MVPKASVILHYTGTAQQFVGPAPERHEVGARSVQIGRLVEPNTIAIENLIGSDDDRFRVMPGYATCLEIGELLDRGRCRRACRLHGVATFLLVDPGGLGLTTNTGAFQHEGTRRACRS